MPRLLINTSGSLTNVGTFERATCGASSIATAAAGFDERTEVLNWSSGRTARKGTWEAIAMPKECDGGVEGMKVCLRWVVAGGGAKRPAQEERSAGTLRSALAR